jgi:NAD(P)H-flavin reductase
MVKVYSSKIEEIKDLTKSVKLFKINLGEDFDFKAGQFVNLSFEEGEKTYRRAYSIASKANKSKNIELCIKLVEKGELTPKLFKKNKGDELKIQGPLGIFTIEKANKDKLVFIGTGTGIAPLRSMILTELEKQNQVLENKNEGIIKTREITLIFGVRYDNEILFKDEFEELAKQNPNFKYIQIVSRPSENWQGRTGHVQDNFDMVDVNNSNVFICGLPAMFEGAKSKLIEMGMKEEDIFHEVFR